MARTDIFKRIKNDKLIESRIQKYRLHFDYLKTCLEFSNDFKVDKSKYIHWKLNLVSKYKFDKWWSQVGKNLFEKEIEQVKEVIETYNKFLEKKIKYRIGPKRSGDSKLVVANPEKFNKVMNWQPKFDNLEYILKTAYEWEKKLNSI